MASKRQIEANRRNAKKSTGPKSKSGRERSSRNALRHGLARSFAADSQIDGLAQSILLAFAQEVALGDARDVASARYRLTEVRAVRHAMLSQLLAGGLLQRITKAICALERYERNALMRQKRALLALRASKGRSDQT